MVQPNHWSWMHTHRHARRHKQTHTLSIYILCSVRLLIPRVCVWWNAKRKTKIIDWWLLTLLFSSSFNRWHLYPIDNLSFLSCLCCCCCYYYSFFEVNNYRKIFDMNTKRIIINGLISDSYFLTTTTTTTKKPFTFPMLNFIHFQFSILFSLQIYPISSILEFCANNFV